jgi:hypothetical protein
MSAVPEEWAQFVDEAKRSVLTRLATFTEHVDWVGEGADIAFADSVLELLGYLNYKQRVMTGVLPPEGETATAQPSPGR